MNEPKHTPAPWSVGTQQYRLTCCDDGDSAIPYEAVGIVSNIEDNLHSRNVASVDFDLGDNEESEANARLIAAAPDLLEELETEESWISNLVGDIASGRPLNARAIESNLRERRVSLQAVIAKATGKEAA